MILTNVLPSAQDDRDYPYVAQTKIQLPRIDLKPNVYQVNDQGSLGSCTVNAVDEACEFLSKEDYSRLFPYYISRVIFENKMEEGAYLRDAIRSAYHYGLPLEKEWPYVAGNYNMQPTASAYRDALRHRIRRYERLMSVPFRNTAVFRSPETRAAIHRELRSVLNEGLPVVIASAIGQQIYSLKGDWKTHKMLPASTGVVVSSNAYVIGHATLIIGYDDACGNYLVQNSWGPGYADGGFFGYPYSALENDIFEAWVIRGFRDVYVYPPMPTNFSKANIYLGASDQFTVVNSGVAVKGVNGVGEMTIDDGVIEVSFDQNVGNLAFPKSSKDYHYAANGNTLTVWHQNQRVAYFPVRDGMMLRFNNGSALCNIYGLNDIKIGSVRVPVQVAGPMQFNAVNPE